MAARPALCEGSLATEKPRRPAEKGDGGGERRCWAAPGPESHPGPDSWRAIPVPRRGVGECHLPGRCHCPWRAALQRLAPRPVMRPRPPAPHCPLPSSTSPPHRWGFSSFLLLLSQPVSSEGPDGLKVPRGLREASPAPSPATDTARPSLPPACIPGRPAERPEWPRGWGGQRHQEGRAGPLRGSVATGLRVAARVEKTQRHPPACPGPSLGSRGQRASSEKRLHSTACHCCQTAPCRPQRGPWGLWPGGRGVGLGR